MADNVDIELIEKLIYARTNLKKSEDGFIVFLRKYLSLITKDRHE